MGGAIAMSVATARPDAVRRLVLMGSVGAAQLLDLLQDARLHVLSGCGHWTMIERTAHFLAVVQPFLAA